MCNISMLCPAKVADIWHSTRWIPVLLLLLCLLSACSADSGPLGGGNWQATGLQHRDIRALEANPNNPQHLYAGDAQGTVFASTDSAQHWTPHTIGSTPNAIFELAYNVPGKKLYAATQQGLFVSTDGAQTWSQVNTASSGLPQDGYTALAFDTNNAALAYVGSARHGVYISTNDGANWSSANSGLPPASAIYSINNAPDTQQLWITTPTGIYSSTDHAASWHSSSAGLPSGVTVNAVVPASATGGAKDLLYAGTNKGFYLSRDAGRQWAPSSDVLSKVDIYCILVDFRSTNATTVYIGTNVGAFHTDDNGLDWSGVAAGLPRGAVVHTIAIGATNNTQLYVGADDVYMFPGTSGGLSPSRIPVFVGILIFFVLLYFVAQRGRRGRRPPRKSASIGEQAPSTPPSSEP